MKKMLKLLVFLLLWTNIILTIQLLKSSAIPVQAFNDVMKVDIVRVNGRYIVSGAVPVTTEPKEIINRRIRREE